jgi:hypothetical protein
MKSTLNPIWEYRPEPVEWADGWAIVAEPNRFADRFNTMVRGAYRQVTVDDIRQMAYCGLIGCHGFFTRDDLETVRGILLYEQLRCHHAKSKNQPPAAIYHKFLEIRMKKALSRPGISP